MSEKFTPSMLSKASECLMTTRVLSWLACLALLIALLSATNVVHVWMLMRSSANFCCHSSLMVMSAGLPPASEDATNHLRYLEGEES